MKGEEEVCIGGRRKHRDRRRKRRVLLPLYFFWTRRREMSLARGQEQEKLGFKRCTPRCLIFPPGRKRRRKRVRCMEALKGALLLPLSRLFPLFHALHLLLTSRPGRKRFLFLFFLFDSSQLRGAISSRRRRRPIYGKKGRDLSPSYLLFHSS